MKLSLSWLQEFLQLSETDPQALADRLTVAVAEVDNVERLGGHLDRCCVGNILSITKHPNADKLSVVDVQTDSGTKRVVCGGTNLWEGMTVAFAHSGARVLHGGKPVTLATVQIRGQESDGMICAAEELALDAEYPPAPEDGERPVIDLRAHEKDVGKSLASFLKLEDTVLHIDNHAITHRADLFSHVGFAREIATLGLGRWKKEKTAPKLTFPKKDLPFRFVTESPALMPRYCGAMVEVQGLGATPDWMVSRLAAMGVRSISLPVDITNYVAWELGVPLHCFDADDFRGDVHMRVSTKGETIVTLDGVERSLPEGALVLSDDEGIFDLLGIMGGLRSSTKETSRRLFVHAASLDPVSIRRTIIATGHRTDAATVYEKGVPPVMVERALKRTIELLLALAPGAVIASALESSGSDGRARSITVSAGEVNALLGTRLPGSTMSKILKDLGATVQTSASGKMAIRTPLWRNDLRAPTDIAEEIGRIAGYNTIEPTMPIADVRLPERDDRIVRLRHTLAERGFLETVPLSLIGEDLLRRSGLGLSAKRLANPLGEDVALLQPSTLPGLLDHAARYGTTELQTFHCAHVFPADAEERLELGLLILSQSQEKDMKQQTALRAAGEMVAALKRIGYPLMIEPDVTPPPFLHPGRAGTLMLYGESVGHVGELHPTVVQAFDLSGRTSVAVVDVERVLLHEPIPSVFAPLPTYPAISYDETRTMTAATPVGPLLQNMQGIDPLLQDVHVVDLYTGKPLKEGAYNLTMRFTYRAPDRTLTEEEAQKVHVKALKMFDK